MSEEPPDDAEESLNDRLPEGYVAVERDLATAVTNDLGLAASVIGRLNNGGLATELQSMSTRFRQAITEREEGDDDE